MKIRRQAIYRLEIPANLRELPYSFPRVLSNIISKGQLMAPLGHTSSQRVHQPQLFTSWTMTAFPINTRAPQLQILTHSPHPWHLSLSIIGMSFIFYLPHHLYSP